MVHIPRPHESQWTRRPVSVQTGPSFLRKSLSVSAFDSRRGYFYRQVGGELFRGWIAGYLESEVTLENRYFLQWRKVEMNKDQR